MRGVDGEGGVGRGPALLAQARLVHQVAGVARGQEEDVPHDRVDLGGGFEPGHVEAAVGRGGRLLAEDEPPAQPDGQPGEGQGHGSHQLLVEVDHGDY